MFKSMSGINEEEGGGGEEEELWSPRGGPQ